MAARSRQQRRFEARKGVRTVGFTEVPQSKLWQPPMPRSVPSRERATKNNDPAYRKSIWPAAKIARRAA